MLKPTSPELFTAEEFIEKKFDLPEGGRWTELHAGIIFTFEGPDDRHGNFVRNISRALAEFVQQRAHHGYACFELGFIVQRAPDSVYVPPVSYLTTGERFTETGVVATRRVPALVVEIASTNDRRKQMAERVETYLAWQVPEVWVADPLDGVVFVFRKGRAQRSYCGEEILLGEGEIEGFETTVAALFEEPEWWTSGVKRKPEA